jgi:hypothetical protein
MCKSDYNALSNIAIINVHLSAKVVAGLFYCKLVSILQGYGLILKPSFIVSCQFVPLFKGAKINFKVYFLITCKFVSISKG